MASVRDLATEAHSPPRASGESVPTTMAQLLTTIEADAKASDGRGIGVHRTGFEVLDHVLEGGLQAGHLTLVGGPPGVGKTVATLQWARNIALAGNPVVFVCYEHDERALFSRVLQMEAGLLPQGDHPAQPRELRRALRSVVRAERSLQEEVAGNLLLRAACARAAKYQHQLALVRGTSRLTLANIEEMVAAVSGDRPVLVVDYLQKVFVEGASSAEDRIATVGEHLKELALSHDAAVVAVVAGDDEALVQRRLRLAHIKGGAALAYEADVVVMLNEKYRAVSRAHTAFDPAAAERFKDKVIFSIEKNRDGPSLAQVQFDKHFDQYRFDPVGSAVEERLVDEHFYSA